MKRLLFALMSFLLTVSVYAETVSRSEALKKAQQFMPGRLFVDGKAFARGEKDAANSPFYVFNAENNDGYVIVSGLSVPALSKCLMPLSDAHSH